MLQKIKDIPRNIKYGFQSLWFWLPVIWKDRQYDHQFIYEIFRHKLHLTEEFIRLRGHHVNHKRDAAQIKYCVNLLDRLIKDEYHENAFKRHYEKWGSPNLRFKDTKDYPGMSEALISYPNVNSVKDEENESKDFKFACEKESKLREQDLDLLFKYMRKHIQGWWD